MILGHLIFIKAISGAALLQWLLGTTLVCLCETWMTMRLWKRHEQQPQFTSPTNHFSIADFVTLGRGLLVAGVAGFLFLPEPTGWHAWLPGSLYVLAVFADYIDGYLARLHNSASEFGAALDRNFDAFTTLIGSLLGILYGHLPSWYFVVGLAFYVFSLATWIMKKSGREVLELPRSNYRRIVGRFQCPFYTGLPSSLSCPSAGLSFRQLSSLFSYWLDFFGTGFTFPVS